MSLSSLANSDLRRKEPQWRAEQVRSRVNQATEMLGGLELDVSDLKTQQVIRVLAQTTSEPSSQTAKYIDTLVRYIPSEALSLYLLLTAALPQFKQAIPGFTETTLYILGLLSSPTLFLLIYMGKRRSAGLGLLPGLKEFPWFGLVVGTVAFAVWALTLPTRPILTTDAGGSVVAAIAASVAFLLPLVGLIFEPKEG